MGFIAVFIQVYFAPFLGDKMKANFDQFKRQLVPQQMRAHLSNYIPGKFGCWKLSLVSVVK